MQAGEVNWILARSALTLSTRPPVEVDPMLINNSSFLTSLETFVCFLSSVLTPSRRRSRKRLISNSTLKIQNISVGRRKSVGQRNLTSVDLGQFADSAQYLTDQTISSAQRRIDPCSNTNQSSGNCKRQQIVFGVERHDSAKNGLTFVTTRTVFRDNSRAYLYFLSNSEDTCQDGTSSYATFEFVYLSTRLIDIERPNNNQARVREEISNGYRDTFDDVLIDSVDVVFQLGRNGNDR